MIKLPSEEQAWLDAYCRALRERFQNRVEEIVIFGSKARGDSRSESDLDVLVVLREGDRWTKKEVRHIGHVLAVTSSVVPSIMVYTRQEWLMRKKGGSPIYQAITRDGVRVG